MAYRDEIARLEAMHTANPEGRVFAHLAEAYRKTGELARAQEVLQAGLERHPEYASAHVVMGRVLLDLLDQEAADQAFSKVLLLDPHNMVALRARGDIAHGAGRKQEALGYYRELTSLDPSDEQTALRIAEIEAAPPAAPDETSEIGEIGEIGEIDMGSPAAEPGADAMADEVAAHTVDETASFGVDEPWTPIAETAAPIEEAAPSIDESGATFDETETPAVDREVPGQTDAVTSYGEAALPTPEASDPVEESFELFLGDDLDEVRDEAFDSGSGDMDLGLGGMLEPTDLRSSEPESGQAAGEPGSEEGGAMFDAVQPAATGPFDTPPEMPASDEPEAPDALAGLGAFEPAGEPGPDAVLHFSGLGGGFTLPQAEDAAPTEASEQPGIPDVDDLEDLAPPIPSAPADEPAPAPARAADDEETPDFDGLWLSHVDGESAALPEPGPELITETIGDLYAQQGLHERAAQVYERLLETRVGDSALEAKLEAARAQAAAAGAGEEAPPESVDGGAPAGGTMDPWIAAVADIPAPGAETSGSWLTTGEGEWLAPDETPSTQEVEADAAPPVLPQPQSVDSFEPLPWEEPASEPDFMSPTDLGVEPVGNLDAAPGGAIDDTDLGLEPVGGGDLYSQPASDESAGVEHVEAAWTGGAGAAADVESPFGWAEPEAATEQSTIGDYLDSLLGFASEAAPPSGRDVPAQQRDAVDDIDALFGDIAEEPAPPIRETAVQAAAEGFDDIDSLFADVVDSADETEATPAPAAAEAGPPAGDFEWDPFAEMGATPGVANAEASAPPPADADAESASTRSEVETGEDAGGMEAEDDDDEDIDMFRTWLQSLKR